MDNRGDYSSDVAQSDDENRQSSVSLNRNSDNFILGNRSYTLDTLASEMLNRIQSIFGIKSNKSESRTSVVLRFSGFIFLITMGFNLLFSLFSPDRTGAIKTPGGNSKCTCHGDESIGFLKQKFGCTEAELFKYSKVYGKDKLFAKCIKSVLKHQSWICSLDQDHLERIIDPSNMAYLLTGPPGTGKTLFVKALAYKVDLMLRKRYLKHTKGINFVNNLKKAGEYESYIDTMESRVEYYYVTPSSINDKYIGESDQNVKRLFKCVRSFPEVYRASFVFFDEAESLFGARGGSSNNDEANVYGSIKSEFLSTISATPSEYKSCFIFAATNLSDFFDTAFKRRFGVEIPFKVPNEKERKILINELLKGLNVPSGEIDKIVKLTAGKAQSYINKRIRSYLEFEKSGACKGLNFKGLKNHLEMEANNTDIY